MKPFGMSFLRPQSIPMIDFSTDSRNHLKGVRGTASSSLCSSSCPSQGGEDYQRD